MFGSQVSWSVKTEHTPFGRRQSQATPLPLVTSTCRISQRGTHCACVIGDFSEIGSAVGFSNFDEWSSETNDKITMFTLDEALASRLDAIFLRCAVRARDIELERGPPGGRQN